MRMNTDRRRHLISQLSLVTVLVVSSSQLRADTGTCGGASVTLPFTDVASTNIFFCTIAEAYFAGLTNGTSPTTYSPSDPVTREQMSAFVTRTLDQSLKRGSHRAALKQWWTPASVAAFELSATSTEPGTAGITSDGTDLWAIVYDSSSGNGRLKRVRASDGEVLQTWSSSFEFDGWAAPLIAAGRVFTSEGFCSAGGAIRMIDPTSTAGPVEVADVNGWPQSLAFDGARIWTANNPMGTCAGTFSVSYVPIGTTIPWTATNLTTGFNHPFGIIYDGSHIWVTDQGDNRIKKVNKFDGTVIQSIPVGTNPGHPVFDGTNIWVPNTGSDNITVVRAKDTSGNALSSAFVLKTVTAPGLLGPFTAAFDGERVLVTCTLNTVVLFKATDLSFVTAVSTGPDTSPFGVCSDGLNFFVTYNTANKIVRF